MAIYTFEEISEMTGYPKGSVSAFASQSKGVLIKCGKGLVDMGVDQNRIWFDQKKSEFERGVKRKSPIAKQRRKAKPKPKTKSIPEEKTPKVIIQEVKPEKVKESQVLTDAQQKHNDFLDRQNALKIQDLEEKVKHTRLKNERLEGDFIDTKHAVTIFKLASSEQNSATIRVVQQMMNQIGLKYKIPPHKIAVEMNSFIPKYNKEMEACSSKVVSKFASEND